MPTRLGTPGQGENANTFVLSDVVERLSWGSVIAGIVVALALQILLTTLGVALGFATAGLVSAETSAEGGAWWYVATSIASLFAGGFVAGRLCGMPLPTAAVLHGAIVWSVVTVIGTAMTVAGGAALFNGAAGALDRTVETVAGVSDDIAALAPESLTGVVPEDARRAIEETLQERDITPQQIRTEAQAIFDEVIGADQRERAAAIARETMRDVVRSPGDLREDLQGAVDRLIGAGGVLTDEDRGELVAALETRFDIDAEQADAIAERWAQALQASAAELRAEYAEIADEADEAMEEAAEAMAAVTGAMALALFIGLVAAALGALLGRPEALLFDEVAQAAA